MVIRLYFGKCTLNLLAWLLVSCWYAWQHQVCKGSISFWWDDFVLELGWHTSCNAWAWESILWCDWKLFGDWLWWLGRPIKWSLVMMVVKMLLWRWDHHIAIVFNRCRLLIWLGWITIIARSVDHARLHWDYLCVSLIKRIKRRMLLWNLVNWTARIVSCVHRLIFIHSILLWKFLWDLRFKIACWRIVSIVVSRYWCAWIVL